MATELTEQGSTRRDQIPALDGIRGFGFLLVFVAHYFSASMEQHRSDPTINVLYYLLEFAWLAVPAFFVLSGYLIGGILFRTRNREGFFRVFYGRRILRVFPVYYVTLIVVALIDRAQGVPLDRIFWSHFLYIQNAMPGYTDGSAAPNSQIHHLWSMAIEEQFYLTWPIVVWFAKDRRTLLKVLAVLVGLCFLVRFISPWIHLSFARSYCATPTRVDAILLGVGLALVADHDLYKRFQPTAKYWTVLGLALWLISFRLHNGLVGNYYRVAVEFPLANFTVLTMIMAVMEEGSIFARVCSMQWVCWLGTMTYGLYVFHFTYHVWFLNTFQPALLPYMGEFGASLATAATALALTIGLGMISYHFLETPALRLRKGLKYGLERPAAIRMHHWVAPIWASARLASLRLKPSPAASSRAARKRQRV